jgi:hypothetical protein
MGTISRQRTRRGAVSFAEAWDVWSLNINDVVAHGRGDDRNFYFVAARENGDRYAGVLSIDQFDGQLFVKPIMETSCPIEQSCPQRVLDAIIREIPDTTENSRQWRTACQDRLDAIAVANEHLTPGCTFKLSIPQTFSDDQTCDTFVYRCATDIRRATDNVRVRLPAEWRLIVAL